MKIGLMADSHEHMEKIKEAVRVFNQEEVEMVLHAGDIISPITCRYFKDLNSKLIAVFGNNDGEKDFLRSQFTAIGAEIHQPPLELTIDGKKVLIYHSPDFLNILAESGHYDLILYGHTHKIDLRSGKTMVVNPGECSGWLSGRATIGILETEDMSVRIVDL
ncbi:MAG: metallophosphoesterase [bacterium]